MVDRSTRVFVNHAIAKHREEPDMIFNKFAKQLTDTQERLDDALREIDELKKTE